jgi:methyltransferase (TIGR00027 family)
MDEGRPSASAQRVAAYRLTFERPEAPFGDPEADERLARDVAAQSAGTRDDRMAKYLKARTAFFDRVLLNALERDVSQVVSIGAGYDGRALRYAKPGVTWFEVDHPATQGDKRERLGRLGISSDNIRFVGADFRDPGLAHAIVGGGYNTNAPSVVLCEGVAVYLGLPVIESVLRELRDVSTVGGRLAVSFSVSGGSPELSARRQRFQAGVEALGEPVRSVVDEDEVPTLMASTGWSVREISKKARRAGFVVAEPGWAPRRGTGAGGGGHAPARASRTEELMERVHHRAGMESLPAHLEATYGAGVARLSELDLGVFRVDRLEGPSWVARVFPAARPVQAAEGDAEILRYLAQEDFPAERLAHPDPVSVHEGQGVLVTEYVAGTAPAGGRQTFELLGDLLGRLHALAPPAGATGLARPGGGWHHVVPQGDTREELAVAVSLLGEAEERVPASCSALYEVLRDELASADDCQDLPHALVHPDFVPPNAVSLPDGGVVIVDWAGSGSGPRLACLGFLLWAAGARGQGCVDAAAAGYRRHVRLGNDELERLDGAVGLRGLVMQCWEFCVGRRRLAAVADGLPAARAHAGAVAARAREAFA